MSIKEGVDYYVDEKNGLVVLTAEYHKKRGYCCGNGCRECPYYPRHMRGNTELKIVDDPNKTQLLSIS